MTTATVETAEGLEARRVELERDLEDAREELGITRRQLARGEADERATMGCKLRLVAIEEALRGLEEAEAEAAEEVAAEEREAKLERLVELAEGAARHRAVETELRRELNEHLLDAASRMNAARDGRLQARRSFMSLLQEEAPGVKALLKRGTTPEGATRLRAELEDLLEELERRGADLEAVRAEAPGALPGDRTAIDRTTRTADPVEPFGSLIGTALRVERKHARRQV